MTMTQDSTHPTGVATTSERPTKDVLRARERKANAALRLRQDNYSWAKIAETLGYPTPRAALIAVEKALEDGLAADESQEFMRRLAGQKLETLLFGVWQKAIDPLHPDHLAAVTKARELIADHAKLMGYNAPQELSIYTPMASEIEKFVALMQQEQAGPVLEEDDIFGDTGEAFVLTEGPDGVFAAEDE